MYKKIIILFLSLTLIEANLLDGKKAYEQKEYTKAYNHFIKSAQDGMIAKFNLGFMYEAGHGVEKNIKQAIYFYTLSANDGYDLAQNRVGNAYFKGIGVKKDLQKAKHYYTLSAKQNNSNAIKSLKLIDNIAYLTIRSDVFNDKVYINDKLVGKSKLTIFLLPNITYKIRVEKKGLPTYYFKDINLKPKEKRTIKAILMR